MNRAANRPSQPTTWSSGQAYTLAVVCLVAGVAVGYLVRGSSAASNVDAGASTTQAMAQPPQPTPEQLKQMADKQVEPLLARLKTTPEDPTLLAQVGNLYYDAQQFKEAISYYEKSLRIQPKNVDVRADMATCYWYSGDADSAIAQFEKVLQYNPKHAASLFNMGVVKWQGKMDPKGAVSAWERLLQTNPDYKDKAKVLDLISRARQHTQLGGSKKG